MSIKNSLSLYVRGETLLNCQPTGPKPLGHRDGFGRPALRHESLNFHFSGSRISAFLTCTDVRGGVEGVRGGGSQVGRVS